MSSTAGRKFMEELSNLLQKHVSIVTSQGKTYVGTLTGVDTEHLSVCLTNAKGEQGDIHKLFINGSVILQISSFEKPFDLQSLGERLERVFPRMVRVMDDAGVILVMDRIRVNEKGIIEGSGPDEERSFCYSAHVSGSRSASPNSQERILRPSWHPCGDDERVLVEERQAGLGSC